MSMQQNQDRTSTAHDVLVERIRVLYGQFSTVVGGSILVTAVMAGLLWFYTPSQTVIYWAVVVIAVTALRFAHYFHIRPLLAAGRDIAPGELKNLCHMTVFSTGASGIVWGVVPWLFLDTGQPILVIFLIVINLGMLATSVSAWSSYMPTFIAFAVPNTLPLVLILARQDDPAFLALAGLISASLLANISYGYRLQKSLKQSIALRFENVDLISKLQHEIDRAEQASRDKTIFIAAASHDLRQPMNALRLFVSSLKEKTLPQEVNEPLANIERSAKSLSDMLNAVLDISKFESGAAQPEKSNFPIQYILSMLASEFASMATDKGLRLVVMPSSAIVFSDPHMLERILRNFISNAYRYTDDGKILVGCRHRGDTLLIEVHDTGRGVDVQHTDKIFEEFFRTASRGGSGHPTGLGLGLAIVDSLSRALDHPVHVSSRRGTGSVFSVEVPLGDEDALPILDMASPIGQMDGALLIIDDDELSRSGLVSITSQWVRTVHASASTEQALAAIHNGEIRPDAVISDYRLEGDDNGVRAIGAVRGAVGRAIPGALVSGDTGDELAAVAEANDLPLLRKPIAPSQLRATVMFLLKKND